MQRATAHEAHQSKTTHSVIPGIGYIRHDVALPNGPLIGRLCSPPPGTVDGSVHRLVPPKDGTIPLLFKWSAKERAWERPQGFRMAFTEIYLGSHGWEYAGQAE